MYWLLTTTGIAIAIMWIGLAVTRLTRGDTQEAVDHLVLVTLLPMTAWAVVMPIVGAILTDGWAWLMYILAGIALLMLLLVAAVLGMSLITRNAFEKMGPGFTAYLFPFLLGSVSVFVSAVIEVTQLLLP
jgi:hypothetical protein